MAGYLQATTPGTSERQQAALDNMVVPAVMFFSRGPFPGSKPKYYGFGNPNIRVEKPKFFPDRVPRGLGLSPLCLSLELGGL